MKNLTKKEVEEYVEINEIVDKKINEISAKIIQYGDYGINSNSWNVESFEFEKKYVSVNIYHSWAYGGYDNEYISFPQSYLWNDNYEGEIKIEAENKKKRKSPKRN